MINYDYELQKNDLDTNSIFPWALVPVATLMHQLTTNWILLEISEGIVGQFTTQLGTESKRGLTRLATDHLSQPQTLHNTHQVMIDRRIFL